MAGLLWTTLAVWSGCSAASGLAAAVGPSLGAPVAGDRVLFVGNSLTEGNDLPLIVEALSSAGGRPLSVESVVYGGVSEVFPQVSESYRLAAMDVGGVFLPAGDAWLAAWRLKPSLALYGPDGFHPSLAGSYLAALTIYAGLTRGSPIGLPGRLSLRNGATVAVDPQDVAILQAAAEEATAAAP